jgi:flagellar basal body-associated protein FliL
MVLIYRGMGIIVPIVFFITGWIVSFWFKDTRLGNPDFVGWTSFYTAIVCFFLGIGTLGSIDEKDHYGNPLPKKKHDFFFIPIIIWALILGGLSAYLLLSGGKKEEAVKEELPVAMAPVIHFYNPTGDTLDYLIYTKDGVSDQQALEPFSTAKINAPDKSYVLGALNTSGEATMTLPYYEEYDAKLYEKVKEENRTIEQRLIRSLSKQPNDYEDNWFLLDGSYDMILVDVSEIYEGTIKKEKIAKIDWMKKIKSRHPGSELIELSIAPSTPNGSVYVSDPDTYLPVSNPKDRSVYMILTFGTHEEVTNEVIKESIERVVM